MEPSTPLHMCPSTPKVEDWDFTPLDAAPISPLPIPEGTPLSAETREDYEIDEEAAFWLGLATIDVSIGSRILGGASSAMTSSLAVETHTWRVGSEWDLIPLDGMLSPITPDMHDSAPLSSALSAWTIDVLEGPSAISSAA